jgi:hypothetical protein
MAWTTAADVERRLRRRWDSGDLLRRWAAGEAWEPLAIGLNRPTAAQVADDLPAARRWAASWDGAAHVRLESKRIGGRLIGSNDLPAKAWIDGWAQVWALLGVGEQVASFGRLFDDTVAKAPRLRDWMLAHPLRVLDHTTVWPQLIATVQWVDAMQGDPVYVRQVDVPGVDTKFIERHQSLLSALLDLHLDPERIDPGRARSDFAARYGFREPPALLRLRSLDVEVPLAGGYTELIVRRDELATSPPPHGTVYVVENRVTYLAFPAAVDAVAIFGEGYAVSALAEQDWLADRDLVYFGDIDTHGFAILDRLRQRFGHTRSLLMDRATFLAHEAHWVAERDPTAGRLAHLDPSETALYQDLVEDTFGPGRRLEQERISYPVIERAIRGAPGRPDLLTRHTGAR